MEELANLFHGFAVTFQPFNISVMVIGIVLGVLIGVLPGLGGANGVAILLPLTFSHVADVGDHHAVLHLLGRVVRRRHHVDSVQHTGRTMVGRDHVRRPSDGAAGPAGEALTAAFTSSFVGALFAVIMITLVAPLVASFRAQFGPAEKFSVYFLAFCSFVGMSKEPPFKTIAAHDDRLRARRGRPRRNHRAIASDLRLHRDSADRVRLPDRGDRPVRHRRNPAHDRRGPELQGRQRQASIRGSCCRPGSKLPQLLGDVAALLHHRLLDGHYARRRDAGLVHELRHRQARLQERAQFRQGRNRRRGRAGNRGACRRHRGAAADAVARRARFADRGRAARRSADLGPAARSAAVRRAEGVRLGPDRLACISATSSA